MTQKIIIIGAKGRMGSLAAETITQDVRFELIATVNREDTLSDIVSNTQADIVLDLSDANSVYTNTHCVLSHGIIPVVGASGLTQPQIEILRQLAEQQNVGGIIVPNFSIGATLMMRFAGQAAQYLPHSEIIEMHHPNKIDTPSGTAQETARRIQAHQSNQATAIHSLRLPGVIAKQQVIFGNTGETLTIEHNTQDRAAFMPGLLLALEKAPHFTGLVVGLEHCFSDC